MVLFFDWWIARSENRKTLLWDREDLIVSLMVYSLIIFAGPVVLSIPVFMIMRESAEKMWRPTPARRQAKTTPAFESKDDVITKLVRQRARIDRRLKGENFEHWILAWFWQTPETMMLDTVNIYHQLQEAGASDDLIWQKLEKRRVNSGSGELPDTPDSRPSSSRYTSRLRGPTRTGAAILRMSAFD